MAFTTDDLAARRAKNSPPDQPSLPEVKSPDSADAIRFSLRELLIAVTVIAALLGLLRAAGILGALLAFLATAGFTWLLYPKLKPHDQRGQRAMFDFLWGVGMPLVCLVFDPFLFKETGLNDNSFAGHFGAAAIISKAKVYDYGFLVYAFVGCQMLVMTAWLVLGSKTVRWAPFIGGFLASGLMFAALVALVLVIPAAIGALVLGIGLLGLTPIITMYVYGRQCQRALAKIWEQPTVAVAGPLAMVGFMTSLLIPGIIGGIALAVLRPGALTRLLHG